jgi:hypothetical protein
MIASRDSFPSEPRRACRRGVNHRFDFVERHDLICRMPGHRRWLRTSRYNHPFRCRCGGNGILGNKVLSVAGFGCRGGEAGAGRARGTMGKGGTAASRREAVLPSRSCRSRADRWSGDAPGSFSRSSTRTTPFSFAHARTAAEVSLHSNRTRTNPFQVRNWSIDRSHCFPRRSPQKTCPRGSRLASHMSCLAAAIMRSEIPVICGQNHRHTQPLRSEVMRMAWFASP